MSVTAPDDAFLDVNDAHLRVFGNVHADGLKLGQLEVVTTTSTGSTIQFLHQHTAFTTTSNIEVGTTNHDLFVDTNASRVGILTNTPTTALDVNGTVKATAFDGDGALLTGIPSSAINGTLSQWTTVTGPKIHYSDGNVGIGIADPLHTLDVVGDINFTGTLREDGNPFVSTPWTIETSPTALSYTSGNVGIGAATPSAKLEVTGNAHVTTDLSVGGTLSINTITAAATHALSAVTAVGASTGDTLQLTNATTGLVTTGNVEVGKELTVSGNVAVDTDTLFVDSVNNRVGVGTTNPQYRLDVGDGGGDVILRVMHQTASSGKLIFGRSGTTDIRSHAIESYNSSGSQNNYMKFLVHDGTGTSPYETRTEVMTLLGNGNVGIGVTDPGARLDVNGDITVGVSGSLRRTADNDLINIYAGSDSTSPYMFMTGKNRSSNANKIGFRIESNAKLEIYTDKIFIADRVGIGYSAPDSKLDLRNTVIYNGETSTNFNPGTMGLLEFWAANTTATRWNMTVHENNDLYFLCRTSGSGGGSWHQVGYLMDNTPVNNIDFTGQHRNFIDGIPATNYTDFEGLIVSANKNKYFDINENITTGANAIQISQSLPLVSLSSKEKDKACFGVISGSEDPESREYVQGSYVSVIRKQKGDTRAFINSVGEGAVWVTNINGSLEAGDYITTSNVVGYGQKQDDDILHNYTVAKITMDCDFDPVTQPVQIIRKETSNVNYWVSTTYENVTEEEYSNLADENRQIVDDIYQEITKEESKTEQEGYELEVRQELVNVLDEHGQLQWEDHPTETEKAYKIRYLDADGNITDEANHVYKAAFVGCTYHCG